MDFKGFVTVKLSVNFFGNKFTKNEKLVKPLVRRFFCVILANNVEKNNYFRSTYGKF